MNNRPCLFLFRRMTSKYRVDFFGNCGIISPRGENNDYKNRETSKSVRH